VLLHATDISALPRLNESALSACSRNQFEYCASNEPRLAGLRRRRLRKRPLRRRVVLDLVARARIVSRSQARACGPVVGLKRMPIAIPVRSTVVFLPGASLLPRAPAGVRSRSSAPRPSCAGSPDVVVVARCGGLRDVPLRNELVVNVPGGREGRRTLSRNSSSLSAARHRAHVRSRIRQSVRLLAHSLTPDRSNMTVPFLFRSARTGSTALGPLS